MRAAFREFVEYRHLLFMFALKDVRVRYKQTVMGVLWALLMPILAVSAGLIVRSLMSRVAGSPLALSDVLSVTLKAVPWGFFVTAVRFAATSLIGNRMLVTKIYFPREVLPLAAVLTSLVDLLVATPVVALLFAVSGTGVTTQVLWLPVLMGLLILFTAGVALFVSCANVFFRDVKYIVDVLLMFAVFFTPVFYRADSLGQWGSLLLLNPVGALLEAMDDVVILHQAPDPLWLAYASAWSVLGLLAAWYAFDRLELRFAEAI